MEQPAAQDTEVEPAPHPARRAIGWWGSLALAVLAVTVLYADMSRLLNPEGEKYLFFWKGGQIDFQYPYLGARALLAGVNPYVNDRPEFTHPVFPPVEVKGVSYKQVYPPGSFVTLMPLAAIYGDDAEAAGRVWFLIGFAALIGTAWIVWWLIGRIADVPVPASLALVALCCLTLDPGAAFGLERGQAELFTALLCWGAVALCLRGSFGLAMGLAVWATSIKGYPLLFTLGLAAIALDRRAWKSVLTGGAVAAAMLVLPAWRYLGSVWPAVQSRATLFELEWYNHSFRHLAYLALGPTRADVGKGLLVGVALTATVIGAVQAMRAFRRGDAGARAVWLTSFATVSLGTVVGTSNHSVTYNFVLLTPGLLILAVTQDRWGATLQRPVASRAALGVGVAVVWWLCFVHRLGGNLVVTTGFPATALGLSLFMLIALGLTIAGLRRPIDPAGGRLVP